MENPFNPGSGAVPPFLAGRGSDLIAFDNMLKTISDGKSANMMLTGLRGTGKTVLLNEFCKMCMQKKFFPIKRSQFNIKYTDPKAFIEALMYDVHAAVASISTSKKMIEKIRNTSTQLKPKKIGFPGDIYIEPSYKSKSIPFENQLEEYLSKNWPIFQKNRYNGIIFFFDEFQYVTDVIDKKFHVLSDFIGAINELQKKGFPYYLVLAGLPKLSLGVRSARPYSERMFRIISLDNLHNDDAVMAISKPLAKLPIKFEKKLVDAIIKDTGQYPYFIQFYCKEILDMIHKKKITLKDYEPIKSIILKHLEVSFFDARIDTLSHTEELLLVALSKITTKDIQFKDIVKISGIRKSTLSRHLVNLEKKDILYNHRHGVYRFSLPMLRDHIIRRYIQ